MAVAQKVEVFGKFRDLLVYYGVEHSTSEADWQRLGRAVYKCTDCGAWVVPYRKNGRLRGVQFGSIVEGSDASVDTTPLKFPFTEKELHETLAYIEGEVEVLWQEANGGEEGSAEQSPG